MHLAFDFRFRARTPRSFQIVEILKVKPELRIGFEVSRETQSGLSGNSAPLVDDFTDAGSWHVQLERQFVHGETQRLHKILAENLSGMDGRQ
jgi:hypothetical protein